MRIGYCSPFSPLRSGVADFSKELVCELARHMEPVLFSPAPIDDVYLLERFETHLLSDLEDERLRATLDLIVYHVGNNSECHAEIVRTLLKHPGVVELHDVSLRDLAFGMTVAQGDRAGFLQLARYCHGDRGVRLARGFLFEQGDGWREHALEMCMNRHVIEAATGVVVHSETVRQMVLGVRESVPAVCVMLHSTDIVEDARQHRMQCRARLKIDRPLVMGCFGFATPSKRILPILDALRLFKEKGGRDFAFYIVGEAQEEMHLAERIEALGLGDNVFVTGFTSLEEFCTYMGACDFCINLRYPTSGESSASLHRMLGMGKPVIVTDVGTFLEYPDSFALKVRHDEHEAQDLCEAICALAGDAGERERRGQAALKFAKDKCDIRRTALRYRDFFEQVAGGRWEPDYEDVMISRLCALGLTDEGYVAHIAAMLDALGPGRQTQEEDHDY